MGVVGIAPEAQLLVMKVFGRNGGAYDEDYMLAIEDALVLGADTINLSLGSASSGDSTSDLAYVNEIMNKLTKTNTVVSISAGNAGYWAEESYFGASLTTDVSADTVGSPGSYTNAFTVASAVNSGLTRDAFKVGDNGFTYSETTEYKNKSIKTLDKTGSGVELDYVFLDAIGEDKDFANVDAEGKVVFVSRGTTSFYEKHIAAAKAGAIACIVYNNQEGTLSMDLTGTTTDIPCISITQADANTIRLLSEEISTGIYTGKITIGKYLASTDYNAADGYQMSDFSSWGVPGSLELKPEITAPGSYIYSTLDGGLYGLMSGTSMAAPSVAGLSALVLQYIKENNLTRRTGLTERALAQSLLMSTATPLTQTDGNLYSPRKQGAGLANAEAAVSTPTYILVGDAKDNDGKVKVELGDDPARTGEYSFDFTVNNLTRKTAYYNLDSQLLTESVMNNYFIANSSYNLSSKIEYSVDSCRYMYDVNQDGRINSRDAALLLKYVNGSYESELIDVCYDDFDFNCNGIVDTDDVNILSKAVKASVWWWKKPGVDLYKKVFAVRDKATVHATIKLNDEDKNYIENNFENGMYVEGFVLLDGAVDLSIPVLAFYGNWTDSSMYEPFDFMEYCTSGDTLPTYAYSLDQDGEAQIEETNYLTYKFAESGTPYYYASNMYAVDEQYIEDRNAISSLSGDSIDKLYFSLIRNAATLDATISNAETGEVYRSVTGENVMGEYYSDSYEEWLSTQLSATFKWNGSDSNGQPLADGTKVIIGVTALPEYYNDGTKVPGKGVTMSWPITIDNTAPTAEPVDLEVVSADGKDKIRINVNDNRYVAAVNLYSWDKSTRLGNYAVNQTELGETSEVLVDYFKTVFYVQVIDYAGNTSVYRVNNSGIADTETADSIELSAQTLTVLKNNTAALSAMVGPMTLIDSSVTWSSADESVATVDANGIVYGVSEGVTTITATTVSKGTDGEPLTASCVVEVFSIDIDLSSLLWDENGDVYFIDFNTSSIPKYTKMFDESLDTPLWAMTETGTDGMYYASAYTDEQNGYIYLVDLSGEYADYCDWSEETCWNTDLATGYCFGSGDGVTYGTYAYYIDINMLGDDYLIHNQGALNVSNVTGGEYLTGIAYAGLDFDEEYQSYVDYFYLVDRSGNLYFYGVTYFAEDNEFAVANELAPGFYSYGAMKLGNIGVSTNGYFYFASLYYDFDSDTLVYSMYDDSNYVSVYAITFDRYGDIENVILLGQFGEGVWPVSGLFQYKRSNEAERLSSGSRLAENFDVANIEFTAASDCIERNIEFEEMAIKAFTPGVKAESETVDDAEISEEAAAEDSLEENAEEATEEVSEEAAEETSEEVAEEAAEEVSEEVAEEVTEETAEEADPVTEPAPEAEEPVQEETDPATEESDDSSSGSGSWWGDYSNSFWRWWF